MMHGGKKAILKNSPLWNLDFGIECNFVSGNMGVIDISLLPPF